MDQVTELCTCGRIQGSHDMDEFTTGRTSKTRSSPTWLESSFVHLLTPRNPLVPKGLGKTGGMTTAAYHPHDLQHNSTSSHGFLEQHQLVEQLLAVATAPTTATSVDSTSSSSKPQSLDIIDNIPLCSDCIDRIADALDADTQRLHDEIQAYRDMVVDTKKGCKAYESISTVPLYQAEQAFEEEILMLQQEVQAREAELTHLHSLYKEQLAITEELGEFVNHIHQDQSALELQAKAFDDSAWLLSKTLSEVQTEVDQLSIVRLPLSLFDLQVDERGLRYPLINQLRLAFWPKGDATESEIRAAWSQATQLLLVLGTLLQYTSSEWKLVPLSDCAKLIYRKEIFNLEPGDCRSLMAWNALLDQVLRHAKTVFAAQPSSSSLDSSTSVPPKPPPFPSSPSSIGNTELARLDRTDHVSWSQVVHRMASNLLWLSENVSEHVALQVSTLAHSVV